MTIPSAGSRAPKPRSALTWLLWLPLIMIGCDTVGMLVSLAMPKISQMRDRPRREACLQNLKRIGLAMQAYHQTHGCFPPPFLADKSGKPQHSWRVLILPFLDEQALYARYRFDEPWNSTHNMALADQMPAIYRCPSETASGPKTSYAMLVGPHAFSDGSTPRRMSDIKKRLSSIIMVAEAADEGINWLEPRDLDTKKMAFYIGPTLRLRRVTYTTTSPVVIPLGRMCCSLMGQCGPFPVPHSVHRSLRQ